MCLMTKQHRLIKADKDIIVYKILRRTKTGLYTTIYTETPIPTLEVKGDAPFKAIENVIFRHYHGYYCISEGVIHTFATLDAALKEKTLFLDKTEYEIFRCVIPKGTMYVMGIRNDCASEEIVFKKRISNFRIKVYKLFNL